MGLSSFKHERYEEYTLILYCFPTMLRALSYRSGSWESQCLKPIYLPRIGQLNRCLEGVMFDRLRVSFVAQASSVS